MKVYVVTLASVCLVISCGGGASDGVDASLATDAAIDAAGTPFGSPCDPSVLDVCGPGYDCLTIGSLGSQEEGFCSPVCDQLAPACSDLYDGPGSTTCELVEGNLQPHCVIHCDGLEECPDGLACLRGTCVGDRAGESPLGLRCTDEEPCPDGSVCQRLGFNTSGYCVTPCTTVGEDAVCQQDYMYPLQGVPRCFGNQEEGGQCMITDCTIGDDLTCPNGTRCDGSEEFSICVMVDNHLGKICPPGAPVCGGNVCLTITDVGGSEENGICSPRCTEAYHCGNNYMFPGQGTPACLVDEGVCVILNCTVGDDATCPPALTCVDAGNDRTMCVPPLDP